MFSSDKNVDPILHVEIVNLEGLFLPKPRVTEMKSDIAAAAGMREKVNELPAP